MTFPAYPEYKDSGVEWVGKVPTAWNVHSLKHLAKLKTEKASSKSFSIALENIESWSGRLIETKSEFEGDGVKFSKNNILFGKLRPYLAKVFLTDCEGEAVGDLYVLQPIDEINPRYFQYGLLTREFIDVIDGSTYGSKMPRASWEFMGNIKFPTPSKIEQESIANFLDHETAKIDSLIAEQEQLIELLKEKRKLVISNAVCRGLDTSVALKDSGVEWLGMVPAHWDIKSIKWLSAVQRGASPRPIDDPKFFDDAGKYAWVRISDVSSSVGVLRETTQRLSELGSSLSVKLSPNTLFISIAGTVGKPCITEIYACIHDGFVYFPNLKLNPKWLFRIFESGHCYAGLGKMGTQLNLNTDTIGSIKISVPPAEEIEVILKFLDHETAKIDSLIDEQVKLNKLLHERRSALISAAVCGHIDVRSFQS